MTLGLDLGQRADYTAVCVAEHEDRTVATTRRERVPVVFADGRAGALEREVPATRTEEHYLIRHLERLPLGTSYPAVAARVVAIARALRERTGDAPWCYVDATGLGQPVVDVLRAAEYPGYLWPVYFTHGDKRSVDGREVRLGKAWMVSRLQALLQGGLIHLPRTAEAERLGQELLDYEIKVDQDGGDTYGAFRVGSHDDLVTSLGLATQPSPPVWTAY